jgi:cysteine-rich repeat protein
MLVTVALASCADPRVEIPEDDTTSEAPSVAAPRDSGTRSAECDQAPDGTPCGKGDAGGVEHCLYNACVLNVCGDGVKAGDEICDDGNQEERDGCSCRDPMCGNGIIDAREQCDDGNTVDGDACDKRCRNTQLVDAGGGAMDASADAALDGSAGGGDSGNPPPPVVDSGSGPADTGIGTADTGGGQGGGDSAVTQHDAAVCQGCVRAADSPCRAWFGYELVAGCFNNPDPMVVTLCVALYRCGLADPGGCAKHPTILTKCYCGTVNIDNGACFLASAVPDGPCVKEVYAASGCSTPGCVESDLVIEGKASFFAYYLAQCSVNSEGCEASCPLPQTVPDVLPSLDAGTDAGVDAGTDAGADASVDARVEAGS